jgi:hypothetical protein
MEEHPHRGTRYARSIRVSVSPYCAIVTLEHVAVHLVPRSGPHGLGEDRVSSSVGSGVTNAVV